MIRKQKETQPQPHVTLTRSKDLFEWFNRTMDGVLRIVPLKNLINKLSTNIFNWGQRHSLYPLHFGIACCALEAPMATANPRYDSERFGVLPRATPRQCDVLLVNGPITKKLKPRIKRLYEQMPEPKWVIAIGECAISGGPFWESYNIVQGVDKVIPVDIYIPGCPPRPESFLDAILKLKEKIKREKKGMFLIGGK